MRKIFLFFCCILYSQLHSQTTYVFNVELNDKRNAPTFNRIGNELRYSGSNFEEKTFFESYTIFDFYQTYPNYSGYLQNIYTVQTLSSSLMNDLKLQFPLKYLSTENLTGMKVELLSSYPNDYGNGINYYNPVTNLGADISLKSMSYINCPKAWSFFSNNKGNVTIGISDGMVNNSDLDLGGKVNYLYQNQFNTLFNCNTIDSRHGTSVASIAAAQGNNSHGIVGVCYDCKIINSPYQMDNNYSPISNPLPNFPVLMEMAELGIKVINMSWYMTGPVHSTPQETDVCGYCTDPTYQDGYISSVQEAINQLHNKGVVLLAGAGNLTSYDVALAPNYHRYVYPASYNHVISVTVVNAKNSNIGDEQVIDPTYGAVSIYDEDLICDSGAINYQGNGYTPFYNASTTTNSRVDICGPGYAPRYSNYLLGCLENGVLALNANATSSATPFVSGTVALMQSLNPCILPGEVEDVLQLTSKNLEANPYNVNFIGRSGSGMRRGIAAHLEGSLGSGPGW
jgi:hypothetical protein